MSEVLLDAVCWIPDTLRSHSPFRLADHPHSTMAASASHKHRLAHILNDEGGHSVPAAPRPLDGRERGKKYLCPWPGCERGFNSHSDYNKHYLPVHLKAKPFKCPQCSKTFGEKSNLSKHVRSVHEGQKNAVCGYEGCKRQFAFADGQKRHMTTVHLGGRPHKCQVPGCNHAFKQKSHLRKVRLPFAISFPLVFDCC